MRGLLFLLNLILLCVAGGLIAANWKFQRTPDDPILRWRAPDAPEPENGFVSRREPPPLAMIRNNNVFSPLRGKEPVQQGGEAEKKNAPPRFELIGICSLGEEAGAIIDAKGGSPAKDRAKRYFAVGEEVAGGFILDSIAENTAILKRRNETIELKIDRSRFGAEIGKSGPPAALPPPPQKNMPGKQ